MKRPSTGFTLVEMLVVMVVIAILVGIVSGMVLGILRKAKIQKAQQEVRQIQLAVEEYYRVFRELPATNTIGQGDIAFSPWYPAGATEPWGWWQPPAPLSDYTMASNFYDRLSGSNPLGRDFLHIARTAENSDRGALLDPWKVQYTFYLDSNHDDTTVVRPLGIDLTHWALVGGHKCLVRCFGPNKVPGRYPQAGGTEFGDDIIYPDRGVWESRASWPYQYIVN